LSGLRAAPPPLVDRERRLIVLWSPRSACTAVYVWFASVCGFIDELRQHDSPHDHRMRVFRTSRRYLDSIAGDAAGFHVVRIIRNPYDRAVAIFRKALVDNFADRDASLVGLNFERGVSFHMFLAMLQRLDMENVDTHYRPQFHPFEHERRPDTVINISTSDLFAELNALERRMDWPLTDFVAMDWFHAYEQARRSPPHPLSGRDLFKTPIARGRPRVQTPFPDPGSLLTPQARALIRSIYSDDFAAYRDFL